MAVSDNSIVFVNQSSGYLMIDIIHAHLEDYDEIVLLTGFLNPRETPLDKKVKVHMLKEYDRSSTLKRVFSWLTFFFQSFYFLFLKYRRSKVYFVSNPPITVFLAMILKRPFTFLIYDVYPDTFIEHGYFTQDNPLVSLWSKVNRHVFGKASNLFTISIGMKEVISTYVGKDEIKVVPVWTDNTFLKPIEKENNRFIKKNGLENRFIVMYSGNIGKSHPVEILIQVAELVNDEEVLFLIVGEGEKKETLIQMAENKNLKNVRFLPYQKTEILPYSLASADIGVVTLGNEASLLSVPSKTFDLMSVGVPLLTVANENSELSSLVMKYNNGATFDPDSAEEIAQFIIKLKNKAELKDNMGGNSRLASSDFHSKNAFKLKFTE